MKSRNIALLATALLIIAIGFIAVANIEHAETSTAQISAERLELPQYARELISHNRYSESMNKEAQLEKFKSFLYDYKSFEDQLDPDMIKSSWVLLSNELSKEKAIEDIEYLFKILKYGYAGYQFFGGDEKFDTAKQSLIEFICKQEEDIQIQQLLTEILASLSFIQDGHFTVQDKHTAKSYRYMNNSDYIFNKENDKYYTYIDNERYYITSVNGEAPDNHIKLSLDEEGNIIFNFGMLNEAESVQLDVKLESDSKKLQKDIELRRVKPAYYERVVYSYKEQDDIAFIESRSFNAGNEKELAELNSFAESALKAKLKDVVVIDIRGNSGGSNNYNEKWFWNFTGSEPKSGLYKAFLSTSTVNKAMLNYVNDMLPFRKDIIANMESTLNDIKTGKIAEGWEIIDFQSFEKVNNENLVIVLMDSNTASAGESLIKSMHTLSNVVFIGTNSFGCNLVGENGIFYLPNSSIGLYYGSKLFLGPNLQNIDGIGFQPDFWIDSPDLVNRVVKFINKYDIDLIEEQVQN